MSVMVIPSVFFFNALPWGNGLEDIPGNQKHASLRAFGILHELRHRGGDIGRGRWRVHTLNHIRRAHAEVARIPRNRVFSEFSIWHHTWRQCYESQTEPKTVRFLL